MQILKIEVDKIEGKMKENQFGNKYFNAIIVI